MQDEFSTAEVKLAHALEINTLGKQALAAKNYPVALQYFQQSLVMRQELGDVGGEAAMLNNISQVYSEQGEDETALLYLQQSFELFEKAADIPGTCAALINMGHLYWAHGVQQDAMTCWRAAYERADRVEHVQALAILEDLARHLGGAGLAFWRAE